MPSLNDLRDYHQNQQKTESREHVLSIKNALNFSRLELPPVNWLVPQLISPGLITIAGRSDAGKSWLLLQLGLAVSAGALFIGNLRCKQADVLYLALEDNDRRIRSRLHKLGMPPTRNLYIDTSNKVTPKNINDMLNEMPSIQMVIIDTLGRYHENEGINGNDYAEVTKAAGALHNIAKEREIAVIACTHTRKGAKEEEGTEGVSGSKALVSVSDTVLMLSRKVEETNGKLYVTGRDVMERTIEMEHTEDWLWFDKNASRGGEPAPEVKPYAEFENFN